MIDPIFLKAVAGLCVFALGVYTLGSYALKVRAGSVKPHPFSWVTWALSALLGTLVQLFNGAGFGAMAAGSTLVGCVIVLIFIKRDDWTGLKVLDWVNLGLALVALVAWQVVDSPEASVVLLSFGLLMGMATTANKAFHTPFTESQILFVLSAAKQCLVLLAISAYGFVTIYPALISIAVNLSVFALIRARRHVIAPGGKAQLCLVGP